MTDTVQTSDTSLRLTYGSH